MSAKTALTKKDNSEVTRAKVAFFAGLMDISWRLAGAFSLPIIIGYIIDQYSNTDRYITIGIFLGVIFAVLFIIKQALDAGQMEGK